MSERQEIVDWASKIPVHDLSDGKGLCRVIFAEDFLRALKDLPSAQPEMRWIPVSERLPEEAQDVLVTVNDGAMYVETDYFTGAHFLKFWDDTTAWMPLPEPYRPEGGATDV